MNNINKLSIDELCCILIDTSRKDWLFLASVRLVCKKWKYTVDKYFPRYIYLNSCRLDFINIKLSYDIVGFVTNVKGSYNGQKYMCRLDAIYTKDLCMCGTPKHMFINGSIKIYFKYKMLKRFKKRFKKSACLYIDISSDYPTPFNIITTTGWKVLLNDDHRRNISIGWKDNKTNNNVVNGWKELIGMHLLNYVLYRLLYPSFE